MATGGDADLFTVVDLEALLCWQLRTFPLHHPVCRTSKCLTTRLIPHRRPLKSVKVPVRFTSKRHALDRKKNLI